MTWGKELSRLINRAEGRVALCKSALQEFYKLSREIQEDSLSYPFLSAELVREYMDNVREEQKEDERFLKRLRLEKQCWNENL